MRVQVAIELAAEAARAEAEKARERAEQAKIANAAAAATAAREEEQDTTRAAAERETEFLSTEEGDNDHLANADKEGEDTESVVSEVTLSTDMSEGLRTMDPEEDKGEPVSERIKGATWEAEESPKGEA